MNNAHKPALFLNSNIFNLSLPGCLHLLHCFVFRLIHIYQMKKNLITLIGILFCYNVYAQSKYQPNWASLDSRPVPQWFTDAKFGIFIHWGIYSVPSWAPTDKSLSVYSKYAEWYWYRIAADTTAVGDAFRKHHVLTYGPGFRYPDFANNFKAEMFDPDQWASILKASGAKYVILTSKHHDGFTLWPSKQAWNWNAMDIGPHRDLAGDLLKAVRKQGLKMGFYYSLYEWFNPLYKADVNKYVDDHMIPQLKDLVSTYKPDILWADGEWDYPSSTWKSEQFISWLYNDSPVKDEIVINDRWGSETRGKHGGYYTTEYNLVGDKKAKDTMIDHPWEETRGIGGSFGLNRAESLNDYATSAELIHLLIDKVSSGGNLLLDIGPAADGTIPVIMQQRLTDMGNWLKVNGEAIYGTKAWDTAISYPKDEIAFTRKGKDLYIFCLKYPQKNITIPLRQKASGVSLLGFNGNINFKMTGNRLVIQTPVITAGQYPCNYAWVFKVTDAL